MLCQLETYSDTDWAGCRRTRRSTTGGYTVAGSHLIKMWCKTQAVVAPSSAEAELYGLVRASAETMGLISMYKELATHMNGVVFGDASAALAIVARRGLGKLRHLDNYLWIQEKAAGDLNFQRGAGTDNGADLFTKTLTWKIIQSHIHKLNSQFGQDEVSVNYVGARPNGVNLPRVLQGMGFARNRDLAAWTRTDMSSRTRRTTMKGGPLWSDVVAQVTADAANDEVFDSELAQDIIRSLEHTPLEGGGRHHRLSKILFGEEECVNIECLIWKAQRLDLSPTCLVNGSC